MLSSLHMAKDLTHFEIGLFSTYSEADIASIIFERLWISSFYGEEAAKQSHSLKYRERKMDIYDRS